MAGALHRVGNRAVFHHQADCLLQGSVVARAAFDSPFPESALLVGATAIAEDDGKRDLAFAEIVAGILAEIGSRTAIIKRIVNKLESKAQIEAVIAQGRAVGALRAGNDRSAPLPRPLKRARQSSP